jgi:PhnB protein
VLSLCSINDHPMNAPRMTPGHQQVMPYFLVNEADAFMAFLRTAFGATDREAHRDADGCVMHAELTIGSSVLMLGQSSAQWEARTTTCYVYVNGTDATHAKALAAGCTEIYPPRDEAYGVRGSGLLDRWGNTWWLANVL